MIGLILIGLFVGSDSSYKKNKELYHRFFGESAEYDKDIRSVQNFNDAVKVRISLGLRQIIRMEDQSQVFMYEEAIPHLESMGNTPPQSINANSNNVIFVDEKCF